jgi:DNA-binding NarL/FixJ family response regulator
MEALVYRTLARAESMAAIDLAAQLDVPAGDVRLCLKALEAKGFVSRLPGTRGRYRAISDELPSPEDMRLLALLLSGYTDEAIAARLDVGARTVQRRIRDLIELTGVRTRLQLVWFATRRGWL